MQLRSMRIRKILSVAALEDLSLYRINKADGQTIAVTQPWWNWHVSIFKRRLDSCSTKRFERSVGLPLGFGKDGRLQLMLLTAECRTTSYWVIIILTARTTTLRHLHSKIFLAKTLPVHVGRLSTRLLCHIQSLNVLFWKGLRPRFEKIRPTWLPTPESTRAKWNRQNLKDAGLCIIHTIQSMKNDLQGSSLSTHT